MKCLSIKQPWPFFIFNGSRPKLVENRDWSEAYLAAQLKLCPVGSELLIHASKGMTDVEYKDACEFALHKCAVFNIPRPEDLHRGGIVGLVRFTGVTRFSSSPWFTGPLALQFANPFPLPFQPCHGQLGFFEWDSMDYNERHTAPTQQPTP